MKTRWRRQGAVIGPVTGQCLKPPSTQSSNTDSPKAEPPNKPWKAGRKRWRRPKRSLWPRRSWTLLLRLGAMSEFVEDLSRRIKYVP